MAVIGAFTLIRFLSLFHIVAAYILLTNPRVLVESSIVEILGESMQLTPSTGLSTASEPLALAALLLGFMGLADLTAASMTPEISIEYWSAQLPVRLFMLFSTTIYTYLTKPDGYFGASTSSSAFGSFGISHSGGPSSRSPVFAGDKSELNPMDLVRNGFVFSAAFLEMCIWFWVYVGLREERTEMYVKKAEEMVKEREKRSA